MAYWLHIAEVAALIAVAYAVGCLVGVIAHRIVIGLGRKPAIASVTAPETTAAVVAMAPAEAIAIATPHVEAPAESVPPVAPLDTAPPPQPIDTSPSAAPVPTAPDVAVTLTPSPVDVAGDRPLIRWYDVPAARVQATPVVEAAPVAAVVPPTEPADPFVAALAALGAPPPDPSPASVTLVASAPPTVETPQSDPPLPLPGAAQAALAAETLLAALEAVAPPMPREEGNADRVATPDPTLPAPSPASAIAVLEPEAAPRPIATESPVAIDERIVAAVIAAAREVQSAPPANVIEPEPVAIAPPPAAARLVDDVPVAKPAKTPGLAWSGMIKGRTSSAFVRRLPAKDKPSAPVVVQQLPPIVAAPPAAEVSASLAASIAAELATPQPAPMPAPQAAIIEQDSTATGAPTAVDPAQPLANRPPVADSALTAALFESMATELAVDPNAPPPPRREPPKPAPAAPVANAQIVPQVAPEELSPEPVPVAIDEDDAMHAIEGGWSRREARAMSGAPELSDVGAAVAAAQIAVETVLAKSGIDPSRSSDLGKPRGLPRPRNSKRDNLQTIRGLGQLDETALNNLGIFHLDQIVEWDQRAILWLENHAFARGRIAREDWQGQARALIGDATDIRVTR